MDRICKRCGKTFDGSSHAWYCPVCKDRVQKEQREKDLARIKNKLVEHVCVVCGKTFTSYTAKSTCSQKCESALRSKSHIDHETTCKTKMKIADKNCEKWHLISPDGTHYTFRNLAQWARENSKLFGFTPTQNGEMRICSGIASAKMAMLGVSSGTCTTYKGWRVFLDYGPAEICGLYQDGKDIDTICDATGIKKAHIRKILASYELLED